MEKIDNALNSISEAFTSFNGSLDGQLNDNLNKADRWLISALSRCEDLSGEKLITRMNLDELYDEAERLEEQMAELKGEGGHQSIPIIQARLVEISNLIVSKEEGEVI